MGARGYQPAPSDAGYLPSDRGYQADAGTVAVGGGGGGGSASTGNDFVFRTFPAYVFRSFPAHPFRSTPKG